MGERQPDVVAAGDDDAVGIENPEAGQRDMLGLVEDDRHQPRPMSHQGGIGRRLRSDAVRTRPQQIGAGGKIERGHDRR